MLKDDEQNGDFSEGTSTYLFTNIAISHREHSRGSTGLMIKNNKVLEVWSSGACNQLTRNAHATWQSASTLRMAGLLLDWNRAGRNINANPNDILKVFDSQLKCEQNKTLPKAESAWQRLFYTSKM
jgi:hypothetical protein